MKIRQAKKIMKNIRLYPDMIWIYGVNKVTKANETCVRHYARTDKRIKTFTALCEQDPLAAIKILHRANQFLSYGEAIVTLRRCYGDITAMHNPIVK